MVALKLNGYTVPILTGGEISPVYSGSGDTIVYGAAPAFDRQSHRRRWSFTTKPLPDKEAEGLIGMLQGRGHSFPFTADLVGSSGHSPDGTAVATIIPGIDGQNDPARVYLESSGEAEAKFWGHALELGVATTNILDADSRDAESAPTGYTATNGATLSYSEDIFVQGSRSVKVTTSATNNNGVHATDLVSGFSVSTAYVGSVYVYTTEALDLRIVIHDGVDTSGTAWTTTPNVWEKVVVTHTTNAAASLLRLVVNQPTADSGKIYYCDAWQIEEGSVATPWADGARAAKDLVYNGITDRSDNLTFAVWTRPPAAQSGERKYLADIRDNAGDNRILLFRETSTDDIVLRIENENQSGTTTFTASGAVGDGAWHHIAYVLSGNTLGTNRWCDLYVDGIREGGSTTTEARYPLMRGVCDECHIGSRLAATQPWIGPMQDLIVAPYAMSADQIAGLSARTRITPGLPYLDAEGDTIPTPNNAGREHNFRVLGKVTSVRYAGRMGLSSYESYQRMIGFELISIEET